MNELKKDPTNLSPAFRRFNKMTSGRVSLPLLWLIGVPVPILIIIWLARGCG